MSATTDLPAMTPERAFDINALLVQAYMARDGLGIGVPDLSGVSLDDAIRAAGIVAATPPSRSPDGGQTLTCHVEPARIPRLYVWAINHRQSEHTFALTASDYQAPLPPSTR